MSRRPRPGLRLKAQQPPGGAPVILVFLDAICQTFLSPPHAPGGAWLFIKLRDLCIIRSLKHRIAVSEQSHIRYRVENVSALWRRCQEEGGKQNAHRNPLGR